jgi:hypothetical protein
MADTITVTFGGREVVLTTLLCCHDCAKRVGLKYEEREGGTFLPEPCRLCGKETYLGEYRRSQAARASPFDQRGAGREPGYHFFARIRLTWWNCHGLPRNR